MNTIITANSILQTTNIAIGGQENFIDNENYSILLDSCLSIIYAF